MNRLYIRECSNVSTENRRYVKIMRTNNKNVYIASIYFLLNCNFYPVRYSFDQSIDTLFKGVWTTRGRHNVRDAKAKERIERSEGGKKSDMTKRLAWSLRATKPDARRSPTRRDSPSDDRNSCRQCACNYCHGDIYHSTRYSAAEARRGEASRGEGETGSERGVRDVTSRCEDSP